MMRMTSALALALLLAGCAGAIRDRIYRPANMGEAPVWRERAPERVEVTTSDGLTLAGLWWRPLQGERGAIVYFHGNGGSLHGDAPRAEALAAGGRGVLMTSYRGYSGNLGRPSETGLRRDAAAFVDFARSRLGKDGKLFLVGHSLGGAVALGEAAARPVDGVATLGAFARMTELAPAIMRGMMPDRYDNLAAIGRISAPVTLFHGTRDPIVPYDHAARLRQASGGRARIVALEGADHHPDPARLAPMIWNALLSDSLP